MAIQAKYERGVFKPLHSVDLKEGTIVEVHVVTQPAARRRSVRDFAFVGMWKDRPEMSDSLEYVNRLRGHLRQ